MDFAMRYFLYQIGHISIGKLAVLGILFFLVGCNEVEVIDKTDRIPPAWEQVEEKKPEIPTWRQGDWEADSVPPIEAGILQRLQPCDGFDYPVGPPNAKDYYKFRGFLPEGLEHLGEDWNGTGGGNTDFGDYVYAAADGIVFHSKNHRGGWGQVIRMIHNYGTKEKPRYIESFFAHVNSSWVRPGREMRRGQIIGTIGDAGGKYHAHLHFEMRKRPGKDLRCGYDGDTLGFVDPTLFIKGHRPLPETEGK